MSWGSEGGVLMPCNLSTAQQDERLLFLKGLSQWKTADPDYLALPASLYKHFLLSMQGRDLHIPELQFPADPK